VTERLGRAAPALSALLHYRIAENLRAMIAAAVAPDASGNANLYLSLSIALTFLTGLICIVASFFRLGPFADFQSKPILVGFLNGIAIRIFLGQVGKLLGFFNRLKRCYSSAF
jgi:MFS superfamily sulfate permease-like transporter